MAIKTALIDVGFDNDFCNKPNHQDKQNKGQIYSTDTKQRCKILLKIIVLFCFHIEEQKSHCFYPQHIHIS